MNNKQIAIAFNECINAQDLEGLTELMTDEHAFIDSANNMFAGKEKVAETWKGFFAMFPLYKNVFDSVEDRGGKVVIVGRSVCPNNTELDGSALWTAKIENDKVAEWRVYDDTSKNRRILGL